MRTAILFASMNVNWMLRRIAEGQGVIITPLDTGAANFTVLLFLVFVVMDVIDFARKKEG